MILLLGLSMYARLILLEALLTIGSLLLSLLSSPSLSNCSLHALPPSPPASIINRILLFFPNIRRQIFGQLYGSLFHYPCAKGELPWHKATARLFPHTSCLPDQPYSAAHPACTNYAIHS